MRLCANRAFEDSLLSELSPSSDVLLSGYLLGRSKGLKAGRPRPLLGLSYCECLSLSSSLR